MYTRGQVPASDKSPCGHSGVSPKFTQTLSYLKLNCRPAWLPLEKHLCTYSEGGERGPQDPGDQTLLSRREPAPGSSSSCCALCRSQEQLRAHQPLCFPLGQLRESCCFKPSPVALEKAQLAIRKRSQKERGWRLRESNREQGLVGGGGVRGNSSFRPGPRPWVLSHQGNP